ncbi:MAG: O-antigen ligase family protein [Lacipirellulaceae bacterium]
MREAAIRTRHGQRAHAGVRAAVAPPLVGARWARVAWVAAYFLAIFFLFEHDPTFAGMQVTDVAEEDIKDDYLDGVESGNALRRVALVSFAAIGATALFRCVGRPFNVQPKLATLVALLVGLMLLSSNWSQEPDLTTRRLVAAACTILGAAGFARLLRPDELLAVALATTAGFALTSLALDVQAGGRPWSGDYRFGGTLHPNIQAAYCALLAIAAFCQPVAFGRRWLTRSLIAIGAALLYTTQSRTSFLAMLAALMLVFFLRLPDRVRLTTLCLGVALAGGAVAAYATISESTRKGLSEAVLMGRTEDAGSFSGRVPLWRELSKYAAARPLLGYGYDSFWTGDRISAVMKSQQWTIQSAHNSYFETVLQLGFVGLALALPVVFLSLQRLQAAYQATAEAGYAFCYGVLCFAMMNSFLESHFAKLKYPSVIALMGILSIALFAPSVTQPTEAKA